jgi:hypothetical protein
MRKQGKVLKNKPDAPLMCRHRRHITARQENPSAVERLEAGDRSQQSRLARAARSQRGDIFPARNREGDVVQRHAVSEPLGETVQPQNGLLRHDHPSPLSARPIPGDHRLREEESKNA